MDYSKRPERLFDVLVFSDLRFPGGTSTSIARAIHALGRAGYRVGLAHVASTTFGPDRPFHAEVVAEVEDGWARLVDPKSRMLEAHLVLFQNPLAFRTPPTVRYRVRADTALLILNQPVANALGEPYYDLDRVLDHCRRVCGCEVVVAPISGLSRDNFRRVFPRRKDVLADDWTEIIDAESFALDRRRFCAEIPVIGRHSRPGDEKWPNTAEEMLDAYPACDEIRVRILGVGPRVFEHIATPPSNWDLFHFGDLDVRYFLSTIDFWVYFHDPAWVEGFGRAIAEAMASGAVTLLPRHFESSFSEGAIYCRPRDVREIVDHLYADRNEYRRWSEAARRVIGRDFGEDRYLERIERLIGPPGRTESALGSLAQPATEDHPEPGPIATANGRRATARELRLDVVYLGDLCSDSEDWPRVAEELALLQKYRVKTGIIHLPMSALRRSINADLVAQVLEGESQPIDPKLSIVEATSVVLTTSTLQQILADRPVHHVFAEQVILLCDDVVGIESWPQVLLGLERQASELYGGACRFSAVRPGQYRLLRTLEKLLSIAPQWETGASMDEVAGLRRTVRELAADLPPRVGVFHDAGFRVNEGVSTAEPDLTTLNGTWHIWWYGKPPDSPFGQQQREIFIDRSEMTVSRFLSKIDAAVFLPTGDQSQPNHSAVSKALRSGIPVILPESCRQDFGLGPLYRHSTQVVDTLHQLENRPRFRREIRVHAEAEVERKAGSCSEATVRMVELVANLPDLRPVRTRRPQPRRTLFMSSNGVGVGHLSRLIAVARRLPGGHEPIFLSLSQALPIVRQFGFHGEFLPYHLSTLSDYEDWNAWLQLTLDQIIEAYSIGTVVFDGNMPYSGLCRAVSTRNGCRMIWIRRGMWRPDQDNTVHLSRAKFADLIIEPEDIASELDSGDAAAHRHETVVVDPIRVLDPDEILSRRESCKKLGLNQRKRYALIQLGAGNNFSNVDLIDRVVATLREIGRVEPIIAEWLTAETPLDLWPDVPRLRCYPISRYYRAFDFTVSAVGYNSFNEIISFAIPSILVPNLNQMMDDQSARAAFADNHRAAIHLDSDLRPMLREVVAAIHDQELRRNMTRNCRALARPNGAVEAAQVVTRIAEAHGDSR